MRHNVDDSSKPNRGEARDFWEAAIRLWSDSGLSVREFCRREGLAAHTFYSWRRELLPDSPTSEAGQEKPADGGVAVAAAGLGQRQRKQVAAGDIPEASVAAPFIELVSPASAGACCCTLELENTAGSKMRVQLKSVSMPDLAAISRSFWNPSP
jgi:transposase-like protein